MALRRALLQALGYPQADTFNIDDGAQLRHLVSWLENTKVCARRAGDAAPLLPCCASRGRYPLAPRPVPVQRSKASNSRQAYSSVRPAAALISHPPSANPCAPHLLQIRHYAEAARRGLNDTAKPEWPSHFRQASGRLATAGLAAGATPSEPPRGRRAPPPAWAAARAAACARVHVYIRTPPRTYPTCATNLSPVPRGSRVPL